MSHSLISAAVAVCAVGAAGFVGPALGQVFDPGPSDSILFDTVIDAPPTVIGSSVDFGGVPAMFTQVNIGPGGVAGSSINVLSGAEFNISGGAVDFGLEAFSGSEVNISGGTVSSSFFDGQFTANTGSMINITGGSVGDFVAANAGSEVNISGGSVGNSFIANPGSVINLSGGSVGSSFLGFGGEVNISGGSVGSQFDAISGSTLNLIGSTFSVPGGPSVAVGEAAVVTTRGGTVLTGTLLDSSAIDFELNAAGVAGEDTIASDATLRLIGAPDATGFDTVLYSPVASDGVAGLGSIGSDTQINLYDGDTLGLGFDAGASNGSSTNVEVNLFGGNVGPAFKANDGSVVNISGGGVGGFFTALSGSEVNLSGGYVGPAFKAVSGSEVSISGGAFELNGVSTSDISAGFGLGAASGNLLTGVLADGTVFIFADEVGDDFAAGTATLNTVAVAPSINPGTLSSGTFNQGVRSGETLTVNGAGTLGDEFAVVDGTLNIDGGIVGEGLAVALGQANIDGGIVGDRFNAFGGSEVNISGGSVGNFSVAYSGSVVNIAGGSVGSVFDALSGSEVNISGGSVGDFFAAFSGSTVNLIGSTFSVPGGPSVEVGEAVVVTTRGGAVLTGTLLDGSAIEFDLNASSVTGEDLFESGASLRVIGAPDATGFDTVLYSPVASDGVAGLTGIGSDTQLNLYFGDVLVGNFQAGSSDGSSTNVEVNVFGAFTGNGFTANTGSVVNVSGGIVGSSAFALDGSVVNISSGNVNGFFTAESGSEVNISGGNVGGDFTAHGVVNLSGGSVGNNFTAESGSEVNITSGDIDDFFSANSGSSVNISGGSVGGNSTANGTVNISGGAVGIGFAANAGSEVNISGGDVGPFLFANAGSTVNISGGSVGDDARANSGSVVNLSGGAVGDVFAAGTGSEVNISGGAVGNDFIADSGSEVNLIGSAFTVAGGPSVAVGEAAVVTTRGGALLAGTLLDGSAIDFDLNSFNFGGADRFAPDATLRVIGAPDATGFDTVLYSPVASDGVASIDSIGSDTQLNLYDGDTLGSAFSAGSPTSANIEVNIFGGTVGEAFDAFADSVVNITGGTVGILFQADSGSVVNISGGTVDVLFDANAGSEVNISGGAVGNAFGANSGSVVNISGGTFGVDFIAGFGSDVTFSGGAFELDGSATSDLSAGFGIGFASTDLLTGVLADGTVFIFAAEVFDFFAPDTTTLDTSAGVAPSANPGVLSSGTFTQGVRSGETLTVNGAGVLGDDFAVVDGTLNISGGAVGDGLQIAFGEVNITEGTVGGNFNAFTGSTVNITGGTVGDFFDAFSGSVVNISGGTFTGDFDANSGSVVNISGGTFGGTFDASPGSTVNLFGTEFFLDGTELTGLLLDEAFTITDRDVALTGTLADGSAFDFDLNSSLIFGEDFFFSDATLTVTLVEALALTGDFSSDGFVSQADLDLVLLNWGDTVLPAGFDVNALVGGGPFDGLISQNELDAVLLNWGNGTPPTTLTAVPEPTSAALLALGVVVTMRRRRM